jgi:hypothetical protein
MEPHDSRSRESLTSVVGVAVSAGASVKSEMKLWFERKNGREWDGPLASYDIYRASTRPFSNLRAGLCCSACLSSGPGTALCIRSGRLEPVEFRAVLCSCGTKIAGLVPCQWADIHLSDCARFD